MGEMADLILMSSDPYDEIWYEGEPYVPPQNYKRCRYCGEGFLHWQLRDGKWRLFDSTGGLHSCLNKVGRKEKGND